MTRDDDLPFIDEHRVLVSASADDVWRSLTTRISRVTGTEAYARLIAAEPRRASGTLFDVGATLPGFRVVDAVPGRHVRLSGRHRFSRYALVLTLTAQSEGTTLSARTYAEFPGIGGRCYRQVVIGSRAHRMLLRRLLRAVGRHAERHRAD